jgi:SAM-dependent methyltransferase
MAAVKGVDNFNEIKKIKTGLINGEYVNGFDLEKKISTILKDKKALENLAKKSAAGIAYNRKMSRFYDKLYETGYSPEVLKSRRFVNFGPGSFKHPYWTNIDKQYSHGTWGQQRKNDYVTNIDILWDIFDRKKVPLEGNSLEVIYSSHVIEHIWNDDAEFLFAEFARLLKTGGTLRLSTPDCDLAVASWLRGDWAYLAEYYWKINKRSPFSDFFEVSRHRSSFYLLDQFSLLATPENELYLKPGQCEAYIRKFKNPYEALDAASEKSSRTLNQRVGKHVNWFNADKLIKMLKDAGFSEVRLSGYGKSNLPILRDIRHFDKTDPEMSLYVEANL